MASSIPSSSISSTSLLLILVASAVLMPTTMSARPLHGHGHLEGDDLNPEKHIRTDPSQSVTMLGRHTFNTTVKQDHVDQWIVLFCVDWLEHCNGLWHDYRRMAMHWEKVMGPSASSWQTTAVRFAEVDCATDKALCNENNVQNYPSVVHFKGGEFKSEWELSRGATSFTGDLSKWIGKVLVNKPVMRSESDEASKSLQKVRKVFGHLRELAGLFSLKDPTTAAIGYFLLAVTVSIVAWIVGTGLELDLKSAICYAKEAKNKEWPSALLPKLPDLGPPRTIVRTSMEL